MNKGRRSSLAVLTQRVRDPNCTLCDLHRSSRHVCILGRGSPKSRIMLVGEAPGGTEAETGEPFRGQAGQLLDKMLDETGLTEIDPYITNVCKCRPPDNRPPTRSEMQTCVFAYLKKELEFIRPLVIVGLGRTAMRVFNLEMYHDYGGAKRGVALRFDRRSTIVYTWHPSYVNRMGGPQHKYGSKIYGEMIAALRLAKETLDETQRLPNAPEVHAATGQTGGHAAGVSNTQAYKWAAHHHQGRRARSAG